MTLSAPVAGPRLLFFDGSGATLETAGMLVDPFAENFDVLAFDQRGLGKTSIPPGPYEMADYDADAAALLDTRFTAEWLEAHEGDRMLAEFIGQRREAPKSDDQTRGEKEQLHSQSRLDVLDLLDAITCPTFVGSGEFDGIAPVANGEAIDTRVPKLRAPCVRRRPYVLRAGIHRDAEIIDFLAS